MDGRALAETNNWPGSRPEARGHRGSTGMSGPGGHTAVIDRLPPQSLEAEQSVLGSILIDRDVIVEVAEFLRPEDFS